MSSDDNKSLVLGYLKAALAAAKSGDFTVADEMVADNAAFHEPGPPASASRAAQQQRWRALVGAFAEMAFDLHDLIGAGDRVVARWSMRGAHEGTFAGVAPTGRGIAMAGITIYRIEGGKIAEAWSSYDQLGVLEQLGFAPEADEEDYEDVDPESHLGMIV